MTLTMSISSRGLVYFPEELQKKLKIKRPGKFSVELTNNNQMQIKPVGDIFTMIGKLKAPDGKKFDIEKFREDREKQYERL